MDVMGRQVLQARSMTKSARNAVFTNIVVVSLALLLSCCTNEHENRMLFGIVAPTVGGTPDTELERNIFACREYGFYPDTKQFDDCMKYVGTRRSISPSPSSR